MKKFMRHFKALRRSFNNGDMAKKTLPLSHNKKNGEKIRDVENPNVARPGIWDRGHQEPF